MRTAQGVQALLCTFLFTAWQLEICGTAVLPSANYRRAAHVLQAAAMGPYTDNSIPDIVIGYRGAPWPSSGDGEGDTDDSQLTPTDIAVRSESLAQAL